MKETVRCLIRVLTAFLSLIMYVSNISYGQERMSLEQEIEKVFRDHNMTAMSIAVVSDDSVIYCKSMGYRVLPDVRQSGDHIDENDMYCLASVSKTFLATTIMNLVDNRKLKLDDDAGKYLDFYLRNPKFPAIPITVRQLLTHTSGINDSYSWWCMDSINPEKTPNYFKCYSDTRGYNYCNLNYTLLGAIIEGVTQRPLDTVIDSLIMKPLDIEGGFNTILLEDTRIVRPYYRENGNLKINDYVIKRYNALLPEHYKLQHSLNIVYPPAGMKISASDLARFMMMHMNYGILNDKRIISKRSELEMQRNYVGENNYGLSFRSYTDIIPGTTFFGQTGGIPGVKTCMIFDPTSRTGYVIVTAGADTDFIDGYGDIHKPLIKHLYVNLVENTKITDLESQPKRIRGDGHTYGKVAKRVRKIRNEYEERL